jgi:hypothetical protein
MTHKLLAVVEVSKESRVICQADGCGRHVFKRIHVVLNSNRVSVLGQQCYSNIYLDGSESVSTNSQYTGTESRKLTPEEIALLVNNTEWLIAQFENELNFRLNHERLLSEERERQRNIEAEHRMREQAEREATAKTLVLKDVKCHYCHCPMQTRAKTIPVVGYKCELCTKYNRSTPSKSRMGITAESNARDNKIAAMRDISKRV